MGKASALKADESQSHATCGFESTHPPPCDRSSTAERRIVDPMTRVQLPSIAPCRRTQSGSNGRFFTPDINGFKTRLRHHAA